MRSNIGWNLAGFVLPMLAGLVAVPPLLEILGAERFGILSLGWMLVGYFGVLDLGLGRALTRAIAENKERGASVSQLAALARHATVVMVSVGVGWMVVLALLVPWVCGDVLDMPDGLRAETEAGFMWLSASIPFILLAGSKVAILEGLQQFPLVNLVRIFLGISLFLAPLAVSYYTPDLEMVFLSLFAVRVIAAIAFSCLARWGQHDKSVRASSADVYNLLRFGGWLTVSNVVGPILTYFDRFYLGAVLSVTAVSYYTVPYDVLARLVALPASIMGVFFPMLARAQVGVAEEVSVILRRVTNFFLASWFPALLLVVLFASDLLEWWVGADVAGHSAGVAYWLALGMFVNGFAQVPYTLLQSAGRSDVIAKFHLAELPVYLLLLYFGVALGGIEGVAIAWTMRTLIDTFLLYFAAIRLCPVQRSENLRALLLLVGSTVALAVLGSLENDRMIIKVVLAMTIFAAGSVSSVVTFSKFRFTRTPE